MRKRQEEGQRTKVIDCYVFTVINLLILNTIGDLTRARRGLKNCTGTDR